MFRGQLKKRGLFCGIMRNIFLCAIIISMLMGCSKSNQETSVTPNELSENVFETFLNKDIEGLKKMFNEEVKESLDLDELIQGSFDFIDGEIVSYDEPSAHIGGQSVREGELVKEYISCEIENVVTDTGKVYSIHFSYYTVSKDNYREVGINYFNVIDEDNFTIENDYPVEYKYQISLKDK